MHLYVMAAVRGQSCTADTSFLEFSSFAEYIKVVNLAGKLKSSKRQASELHFDSCVQSLGKSEP